MKKKGFTLIELLAVIVVLSVVAIITIVVIGNVIEEAKIKKYYSEEKAMEHAAELYLVKNQKSLENGVSSQEISLQTLIDSKNMKVVHDTGNGKLCDGKVLVTVGENSTKTINFKGCLKCSNYQTKDQECGYDSEEEKEEIVEDKKAYCLQNEKKGGKTYYYIDSVEDLYAFSDSVNNGTNYSDSVVMLRNDLDMSKQISSTQETCDGTKVTVSTFKPIGTSTNQFKGTFEGNAKTISNLTINEPSLDNVGLFGYNLGNINGLNIENINVIGKKYVGGLVGYNSGNINDISISGSVSAPVDYGTAGGIVGYSKKVNETLSIKNVLVNANITAGRRDGGNSSGYADGIGYINDNDTIVSGVIDGGSIYSGYTGGKACRISSCNDNILSSNGIGLDIYTSAGGASNGLEFDISKVGSINGYDKVIDTYLGGDNDDSGYYFDYNDENKIVVKSSKLIPSASKKLKGSGTKSDPYQISSVSDWNVAVANIHYYYILKNDIDFQNKNIYMLGSYNATNSFDKKLNGNGYTLKNIKVKGIFDVGVIGYNTGVIEDINFSNVEVNGDLNVGIIGRNLSTNDNNGLIQGVNAISVNINALNRAGGLVGYNSGNINEISVSGDISAPIYAAVAGGVVGYSKKEDASKTLSIKNVLVDANIIGGKRDGMNSTGSAAGIGYIYDGDTVVSGVIEGKSIVAGWSGSKSCNVADCNNVYVINSLNYDRWSDSGGGSGGKSFDSIWNNKLYYYGNTLGLDTSYTGDKGNNGYYFDYTSDNTDILVTKVGSSTPSSDNIVEDEETGVKPSPGVVSKSHTTATCENDKEAPTCTLNSFSARSSKDGMTASFTCIDDVGVTSISSLFDSTRSYKARNFDDIGTIKPGIATDNNGMYWFSTWTADTDKQHPPQSGICYFFHYGAIDNCGNYSTYKTNYCLGY